MDDITKIIWTSSLTVLSSVIILVIGQIIVRFIIEPIHEFKKVLGEIRYVLEFHGQAIHTPMGTQEKEDKAQEALRKLSCDLLSKMSSIPLYRRLVSISWGFLPLEEDIREVLKYLTRLSNSVHKEDRSKNFDVIEKIYCILNLEPPE